MTRFNLRLLVGLFGLVGVVGFAQRTPPTYPPRPASWDKFGGDPRIATATPKKAQTFQGTVSAFTTNTITDATANFPTDGSMVGQYLTPNLGHLDTGNTSYSERWYRIISNTATTITVDPNDATITTSDRLPDFTKYGVKIGSTYQVLSPFWVEKVGNRWWMMTPYGHGFFGRGLSKTDDNEQHGNSLQFPAVYLQDGAGVFSPNLSNPAFDTSPSDVIRSDGSGVSVDAVNSAIYIGDVVRLMNIGIYANRLGDFGGAMTWYYSAPGGTWKPIPSYALSGGGSTVLGQPYSFSKPSTVGIPGQTATTYSLQVAGYYANGVGWTSTDANAVTLAAATLGGNNIKLWPSAAPADFTTTTLPNDSTPRYYIKGVVTTAFTTAPILGRVFNNTSMGQTVLNKYGNYQTWFNAWNQRMDNWGMNMYGQYSYRYQTQDGSNPNTRKPILVTSSFSGNSMILAKTAYKPGGTAYIVKNLWDGAKCWPGQSVTYQGINPDAFDPQYPLAVDAILADGAGTLRNPWQPVIITDEADYEFGFNQPIKHPQPGYIALTQNPYHPTSYVGSGYNTTISPGGVANTYSDPKMYSKYALRDIMRWRYAPPGDTIAPFTDSSTIPFYTYSATPTPGSNEALALTALCAAWGIQPCYTTWDTSSGSITAGTNAFGTGTGFMDDDGHRLFPTQVACSAVYADNFKKTNYPAVKTDMEYFAARLAARMAKALAQAKNYTNNLTTMPIYHPRDYIADAVGSYMDVMWAAPYNIQEALTAYNSGHHKPIVIADYTALEYPEDSVGFGGTVQSSSYDSVANTTTMTYTGVPYMYGTLSVGVEFPDSTCTAFGNPGVTKATFVYGGINTLQFHCSSGSCDYTCVHPGDRVFMNTVLSNFGLAKGQPPLTQAYRAQYIIDNLNSFVSTPGDDGTYFTVGWEHWAMLDAPQYIPSDSGGWGFVTANDNAYDGYEAMKATGTDGQGFNVGGEARDYGDVITPISNYFRGLYDQLVNGTTVVYPPTITTFTISKNVFDGGPVTLAWTTQNATTVTISGIGTVVASGSTTVTPTSATSYTMTASNTVGNDVRTVSLAQRHVTWGGGKAQIGGTGRVD